MNYITQLAKNKNKRYLILSAGGQQSGIQGIYLSIEGESWSIISHAFLPYPSSIKPMLDSVAFDAKSSFTLDALGKLDYKISQLFLECAKAVCLNTQKSLQQPHVIVLNKFNIWKSSLIENVPAKYWNLELGDATLLAATFKIPVLTDFIRYSILKGSLGDLPLFPGICKIAKDNLGLVAHLTIGQLSHILIHDVHAAHTILNTDTGPGTCLINKAAQEANCLDGFDRDGSYAAQGKVDTHCLETIANTDWFRFASPKQASVADLMQLYDHGALTMLSPLDKLATLTALTARSAFDIFKKEYQHLVVPEALWISGGGANNLVLMDFLKTYFDPLPIKRIDVLGIPAELFVPLSLGLTVDSYCMGFTDPGKSGTNPEFEGLGTWVGA